MMQNLAKAEDNMKERAARKAKEIEEMREKEAA